MTAESTSESPLFARAIVLKFYLLTPYVLKSINPQKEPQS